MKKTFAIISLLFYFSTTYAQTIPDWKIGNLEEFISKSETPLIINFWATYCGPCLKEIPYFEKLTKQYKENNVRLLLISLDFKESYPDKIEKFITRMKFSSSIVWLNETNADYFCPKVDSKWSGVMPATLFINKKTSYRHFIEESISESNFDLEIKKLIDQ